MKVEERKETVQRGEMRVTPTKKLKHKQMPRKYRCTHKCFSKLSFDDREKEFQKYWALPSQQQKNRFLKKAPARKIPVISIPNVVITIFVIEEKSMVSWEKSPVNIGIRVLPGQIMQKGVVISCEKKPAPIPIGIKTIRISRIYLIFLRCLNCSQL